MDLTTRLITSLTLGISTLGVLHAQGEKAKAPAKQANILTDTETFDGWKLLFKGSDLTSWRAYGMDTLSDKWCGNKGTMQLTPGGGDLISKEKFTDYELKFEWKVSKGGQAGIILTAPETKQPAWKNGIKMHLIDNNAAPIRVQNDQALPIFAGSCDFITYAPKRISKAAGQWNQVHIIKHGTHYRMFLNGVKTADFKTDSISFQERIANSIHNENPDFGQFPSGHIILEDLGSGASFRNVKVRPLDIFVNRFAPIQDANDELFTIKHVKTTPHT